MRPLRPGRDGPSDGAYVRPAGSRPSLHGGARRDLPGSPEFSAGPLASSGATAGAGRGTRRDPAPSRFSYRLNRLWLTPLFRTILRVGVPAYLIVFALGIVISDEARRDAIVGAWDDAWAIIEARPEFRVKGMTVEGASATVESALRAMGPESFPVSSFQLDLEALRTDFEALDAVARANLRITTDGMLAAQIREREPAVVWRSPEGLELLDGDGHRVARLRRRAARADLPLIGGEGADAAVPEALELIEMAEPLGARLRGLVRVGERRWDVLLSDGRRLLLPAQEAGNALERVIALDQSQELLQRDVALVDMRLPGRPTVRMSEEALVELRRIRALERGESNR